jgi:hypothetical protein
MKAAEPLEKWQNNKYNHLFIKSFTLKVFMFKFVNTHVSLFYTIYTSSSGDPMIYNENAQQDLYILITGMIA